MEPLNLPEYKLNIKVIDGKHKIFDGIRKKYVLLTPEEWVRQNFLQFLIQHLKYPRSLIQVETGLKYNTLPKRSDIVIFNQKAEPILIVECKSPSEAIKQEAFDQVAVYNKVVGAGYLIVTNGLNHYCCRINTETGKIHFLDDIPEFDQL